MDRIGVGFIDLDHTARFHFQSLLRHPEFSSVAQVSGPDSRPVSCSGVDLPTMGWDEILQHPEVILLCTGAETSPEQIGELLEHGKFVLCQPPIYHSVETWRNLLLQAELSARLLCGALHRWDSRSLTVQQLIRSRMLGEIREIRRISRQYLPGDLTPSGPRPDDGLRDTAQIERLRFRLKWFEMLDELQLLHDSTLERVVPLSAGRGSAVQIEFADGCIAHVELNHHSLAPIETGWVLEGTTGGSVGGRRFRASSDCELIDVPLDELPTQHADFYNSIRETIKSGCPFPVTSQSLLRTLELWERTTD